MANLEKNDGDEKPVEQLSTKDLLNEAQMLKNVIFVSIKRLTDIFDEVIVKRLTGEP